MFVKNDVPFKGHDIRDWNLHYFERVYVGEYAGEEPNEVGDNVLAKQKLCSIVDNPNSTGNSI